MRFHRAERQAGRLGDLGMGHALAMRQHHAEPLGRAQPRQRTLQVDAPGEAPQFMGVPVPVVLGVLAAGLALLVRPYVLSSGAGAGLLEPIE